MKMINYSTSSLVITLFCFLAPLVLATTAFAKTSPSHVAGASYCTYAPDKTCYISGRPACCKKGNCPTKKPGCDKKKKKKPHSHKPQHHKPRHHHHKNTQPYGRSYCTYAPDKKCYPETGWPSCCSEDSDSCPTKKPACENNNNNPKPDGSDYCTWSTEPLCYKNDGYPECCSSSEPSSSCPKQQPPCDIDNGDNNTNVVGQSYCTYAPDEGCWVGGYPPCCLIEEGANCPPIQPECNAPLGGSENSNSNNNNNNSRKLRGGNYHTKH